MKNLSRIKWVLIVVGIIIITGGVLLLLRGNEDTWIKDSRGVWVKHGNPSKTPIEVSQQQEMIEKAQFLYQDALNKNTSFDNGPCLGKIADDWVVDTVHNPRQNLDDRSANQCGDYLQGKVHHFIELGPNGDILKIE